MLEFKVKLRLFTVRLLIIEELLNLLIIEFRNCWVY